MDDFMKEFLWGWTISICSNKKKEEKNTKFSGRSKIFKTYPILSFVWSIICIKNAWERLSIVLTIFLLIFFWKPHTDDRQKKPQEFFTFWFEFLIMSYCWYATWHISRAFDQSRRCLSLCYLSTWRPNHILKFSLS